MSNPINPRYEPRDPDGTRLSVVVYCDVNLAAFAHDYGVDLATALQMAQSDVRDWVTDMTQRLNAAPRWEGIGTWGVKG